METVVFSSSRDAYLLVGFFLVLAALIPLGKWAMSRGRFEAPETVEKPHGCLFPIAFLILIFCASTQFRRVFAIEAGPTTVRARFLFPRPARSIAYADLAEARVIRHGSVPPKFWLELRSSSGKRTITQATESREDALRAAAALAKHGVTLRWVVRVGKDYSWTERTATETEVSAP